MCNEDIYPGELPMGLSTLLSRGPHSLLAAHCWPGVEPPRTYYSSSTTWAPSNRTNQLAVKRAAIPVDHCGAQHIPVVRPPSTFGRILRPCFEFRARAGPEAAVVDDEGVGLPGELFRPSCCRPPPRSSPRSPWSLFLRPRPDLTCQVPPPRRHVAHAGSRNEVIAGRSAAC
jgi:hypothetical protein